MRLLQAGWGDAILVKVPDPFCHSGVPLTRGTGVLHSGCSRLRLASCDETCMPIASRHSEDARRNSACRMRIGSGVLS